MGKVAINITNIIKNKESAQSIYLLEQAFKELERINGHETELTKEIKCFLKKDNKNYILRPNVGKIDIIK